YGGLGLLLLNYRPNKKITKGFNLIFLVFFFISLIRGEDPNTILFYSRNYISVVLMYSISLLMIADDEDIISFDVLFYLFGALFISVMSVGRGGIMSFTIAVILYLLLMYSKQGSRNYLWLILITILAVTFVLVFILPNIERILP